MRRSRLAIAAVGAAGLLLAGCAGGAAGEDGDLERVRFALQFYPNTDQTGLFVALEEGWFEEAGIEVEVLPWGETSTDTLISTGQAEIGITFQPTLTTAYAAGLESTAVMSIFQHEAYGVGALESNEEIRSPRDFDGKIYGNPSGNYDVYYEMTKDMIVADGGTGEFETVTLADQLEALYAGETDFAGFITPTWEGVLAEAEGMPIQFWYWSDFGAPFTYQTLVAANPQWLESEPEVARDFIQVLQRGYEYAADHPDEAVEALFAQNPGTFDGQEETVIETQRVVSSIMRGDDGSFGVMDPEVWQIFADYLVEKGLIVDENGDPLTEPFDTSGLSTNEYLADE